MRIMPALARLTAGSTAQQAAAEGTAAARSVKRPMAAELLFGKGGPVEVRVNTLADSVTQRVKPALLVLMVAVGSCCSSRARTSRIYCSHEALPVHASSPCAPPSAQTRAGWPGRC
jgi:3-deoxy-D-arabino-heptulosonate 7-phosphate (DAHP) synthase class II